MLSIYNHNDESTRGYSQKPPPISLQSWEQTSSAGPLAAFAQLDPMICIHGVDCEDPIGVLGDRNMIYRPADHIIKDTNLTNRTSEVPNLTFLLGDAACYLVDRLRVFFFFWSL